MQPVPSKVQKRTGSKWTHEAARRILQKGQYGFIRAHTRPRFFIAIM